tara:strand:- start:414 stop:596 length:183 start_codon:yes stop_codon:yes gene_type:complete
MTVKRKDTPMGKQEKHLQEKYGHLRKKQSSSENRNPLTIEITDEERKVLLSLVSKIEGGE